MDLTPDMTYEITDDDLGPAFRIWAEHQRVNRGKTADEVITKVAQFAVSFAMRRIEEVKPGSKDKVRSDLMKIDRVSPRQRFRSLTKRKRVLAKAELYRGTVAAALVALINYNGARTMSRAGDHAGFYTQVAKFVRARIYSVKHHKVSGFMPALYELSKMRRGMMREARGPRVKKPPGAFKKTIDGRLAEILIEAWPTAAERPNRPQPVGLRGMVPDAFSYKMADLSRLFLTFVTKDGLLWGGAKAAGFKVQE